MTTKTVDTDDDKGPVWIRLSLEAHVIGDIQKVLRGEKLERGVMSVLDGAITDALKTERMRLTGHLDQLDAAIRDEEGRL